MKKIFTLLLFMGLFMLSSCGFKPLHGESYKLSSVSLNSIEITALNTMEGAEVYYRLKNIMPHSNSPLYSLSYNISFVERCSVIQKNSDILRELVTISVSYNLKDKATDKLLYSGSFSRLSSYNTGFSPYSNEIEKQDTIKNLSIASAEEIKNRLILYFINKDKRS